MPPEIHLFDIYRSANIGIFLKTNDKFCLAPKGIADTKSERLRSLLKVQVVHASVADSRLLGPLTAMNNKGIVVSRLTDDDEIRHLSESTGLNVQRIESRFTSVGNLIAANDNGAIISDVFGEESAKEIERTLEVPVKRMRIGTFIQIGAMISTTNVGALIHPAATEDEITIISGILGFEPEPATINGGVPFVNSGFVGNSNSILVGARTRGAELMILSKAFG
ncbi:MAG TPA: translation initiation factor IF-6 [Nitrososphaerales archaeon]|nr:translation initiation factor IF-6 [Nitrososphaerales archaeon]